MKTLLLAALFLSSCAHQKNQRNPSNTNQLSYPLSFIGKFQDAQGNAQCTGTLVSECHVLTAGSCLGRGLQFVLAGEKKSIIIDATITPDPQRLSWALVRLKSNFDAAGWMRVSNKDGNSIVGSDLTLAAFHDKSIQPVEKKIKIEKTDRGWFGSGDGNRIKYSQKPFSGIAGAPLFIKDEEDRSWIVAVHIEDASPPDLSTAVAGEAIEKDLQAYMDSLPCTP